MLDSDKILEQTCREAERLFGARASLLEPGQDASPNGAVVVPLRVRDEQIAAIRLEREQPFERWDVVRARVLADFAARATENARLLAEAKVREAERAVLSDQLITAEQEERRRLALFLHDTAVQSLSGIGLMLEHVLASIGDGQRRGGVRRARERARPPAPDDPLAPRALVQPRAGRAPRPGLRPGGARARGAGRALARDPDRPRRRGRRRARREGAGRALPDHPRRARTSRSGAGRRTGSTSGSARSATARSRRWWPTTAPASAAARASTRSPSGPARSAATLVIDAGEDGGTAVHVILPAYVARR